MWYHQKQYSFYNPSLVRVCMGSVDCVVNYVEMLDESCVELQHVHKGCYEVYHCLRGALHMVIGSEHHTLTSGSFALIRPGTPHHTVYEPHAQKLYCVFIFTEPFVSSAKSKNFQPELDFFFSATKYFESHTTFISQDQYQAQKILSRLEEELSEQMQGRDYMISTLYQQYIIAILRHLLPPRQEEPALSNSNINLTIAITKYMHANYYKNITIQDIADYFFVSSRHINRVFEDFFGQSFKRTLNIYRINYAKNYFLETDYSVEKIAALVGLSSSKTLYQLFKENEGITVAEFRARFSHQDK